MGGTKKTKTATLTSAIYEIMSLRTWTSSEDRRRLEKIKMAVALVLVRVHAETIRLASIDEDDDDNDGIGVVNSYLSGVIPDVLVPLLRLAHQQYARVVLPLVDESITFGMIKTIDDFSESDCQFYFRFLKEDLKIVARQLWPRISLYLQSENPAEIKVGGGYIAHYETCLCVYLFKMSRPQRLIGDAERFFGIRKSKLSRMIIFLVKLYVVWQSDTFTTLRYGFDTCPVTLWLLKTNVSSSQTFGVSSMVLYEEPAVLSGTRTLCTLATNGVMGSSSKV